MNWTGRSVVKAAGVCIVALFVAGANGQDADGPPTARVRTLEQSSWPHVPAPEGTAVIPVRVSKAFPEDATHLKVCTYAGGRPQTWQVLTRGCYHGADYCTVFVAAPLHDVMAFIDYDVGNPPVAVASDDVCTEPRRNFTRTLGGPFPHPPGE